MNFNTVRQANGQNVTMGGIVSEVGVAKLSNKNKPYQSAKITDVSGEGHSVTIHKGNGQLLDANQLGQTLSFAMSTYQGQQGIAYSGFYNSNAQVAPLQQPASNQPQQAAPAVAQPSNTPEPDWDAKDLRMARMAALKSATQLMCLMAEMMKIEVSPNTIKKTAAEFVEYIYNGLSVQEQAGNLLGSPPMQGQPNPEYKENPEPPAAGDPIPF